jgi:cytoskeletal protein CcmA (bactofilin family)
MGDTYTRQSSSTIVDGTTIEAAHFNNEFDQLVAAFAVSSGHTHDGTTAEGGPVTKLLGTAITIGDATAGTDITVTFDGESNDGVLAWMEDEDYFKFSDDILLNSTERLNFGDTGTYIFQSTDGQLDIVADTELQIAATTVDINGNVDISGTLTVAGAVDFGDAALSNVGAVQLDSISGDGDTNTSITFSGSDVITIATGGAGRLTIGDGALSPVTNNQIDLGTASLEFKDGYFDGTVTADAFAGPLTGNVTGNVSGTAATVTTAAQSNITSLGTLTTLTVDNIITNGTTIGHTDDTDLLTLASGVLTVAGELDAVSLDISGDADIDGTLEADAITIGGITLAETIADTVGAMVTSNTESGITVAYDDADNTLDFTVGTLNQNTTGSAATLTTARTIGGTSFDGSANIAVALASTATALATARTIGGTSFDGTGDIAVALASVGTAVTVADEAIDTTCFPLFTTAATGDLPPKSSSNLTFNSSSGLLTATSLAGTVTTATQNSITTATGLVSTGALNSGSITSGFGTIDTGASAITTTGLISGGSLDIDNVLIDGTTIGHTDDTDLITVAANLVTVAGEVQMTTLDIGGTNVTSTAAELNYSDLATLGTTAASKVFTADANNLTKVSGAVLNIEDELTDEATVTWNVIDSPVAKLTMADNRTLSAPSGTTPAAGQFISLLLIQDGTGSRTITWNAVYEFTADTAPTLTTTANLGDLFVFRYNGAKWLEVGRNLNLTLA